MHFQFDWLNSFLKVGKRLLSENDHENDFYLSDDEEVVSDEDIENNEANDACEADLDQANINSNFGTVEKQTVDDDVPLSVLRNLLLEKKSKRKNRKRQMKNPLTATAREYRILIYTYTCSIGHFQTATITIVSY